MQVLRIDLQGVCRDMIFNSLEELRLNLCSYHSVDWEGVDNDNNDLDIFTLTLDEICDYGEWDYKIINNNKAVK
tara:strand:+ start:107 stop:328 length:222 start_codon:yes stop_codon:yes gene_type:complete